MDQDEPTKLQCEADHDIVEFPLVAKIPKKNLEHRTIQYSVADSDSTTSDDMTDKQGPDISNTENTNIKPDDKIKIKIRYNGETQDPHDGDDEDEDDGEENAGIN